VFKQKIVIQHSQHAPALLVSGKCPACNCDTLSS